MPPTTNAVRTKGFLSSIGVEYSMLFMLGGLALAVFTMLSFIGDVTPTVDAKAVTERAPAEPELDFAPSSTPVVPAKYRTAASAE